MGACGENVWWALLHFHDRLGVFLKGLLFFGVFVTLCNCFLCIYFTCALWIEFVDLGIVYKKEATFT